jgi:hypothetical protein
MKMMLGGMLPRATIWKLDSQDIGGRDAFTHRLLDMFTFEGEPVKHPLDSIRDLLLPCRSIADALSVLNRAEERGRLGANVRSTSGTPVFDKSGRCGISVPVKYAKDLVPLIAKEPSSAQACSKNSLLPPLAQMAPDNFENRLAQGEEDPLLSLFASTALAGLEEQLSIRDADVIANWAGLPRGAWSTEHEAAYLAAYLHWLRKGEDLLEGMEGVPSMLAKLKLPPLPAPITSEIRSILVHVNIPPFLRK